MIEKQLQHCRDLVVDPAYRADYLLRLKDQGRRFIGCFSNYIPEEVILAAGLHPVRIIGTFQTVAATQPKLANPVCSFVQDVYAVAMDGQFAMLDAVVFPHSCDSLKHLRQRWDAQLPLPPTYSLQHPVRFDDGSVDYFAEQIRRFGEFLTAQFAVDITNDDLIQAIEHTNRTRRLLRQIYKNHQNGSASLSGSQIITLITAGMIMDRAELYTFLQAVLRQADPQPDTVEPSGRVMLVGPVMDNLNLLEQIEQMGLSIVDDELTNGSRYIGRDVQSEGDLFRNLARRYLQSADSPTLYTEPEPEMKAFCRRIETARPDGVLFIIQKFCEPHIHGYLSKAEQLEKLNIPVQRFEIEHDAVEINERQRLQLESFAEVITDAHAVRYRHSE